MKEEVLFICNHNSARSQMAEALLNYSYGDFYNAYSGGSNPKSIHPYTIRVLNEIEIDISGKKSKCISEFKDRHFDYVVTLCDNNQACPIFLNCNKQVSKTFKNPIKINENEDANISAVKNKNIIKNNQIEEFRMVRDQINKWIIDYFKI
ncbi:MAG: arsenate reductase ArsC [Methanobacteriaceae archaeon]